MEDRHVKMGRKNSTRAALLALTILLASILAPLSLETSGDMPKDNFFQAIPGLEMPALDLRDLAYSTATGEWVFASSVGLYYYNPDAAYEDAWRLEAPDMDVLAVEPGPWGVAAVGRLGAEGMMLVERANYENGSVVQSGELDLANSVSATADAYGYASFEAPVGETIFQDDFEGGFSGQWTTSNAYLDSDAYGGNWAARIAVEASGSPISASLSTNQGTNTTFHSGYDLEEVLWTAEYDGNMHTVVKDVVPPPSGSGTIGDPYMIYNVWDLQNINNNLAAHYALANDIDATETVGWNGGAGFMPVGTGASRFTGSLDGRNYTITGLYISRPGTNYVGLFGSIGTAASLTYFGLKNAEITGNHYVGGIAGESDNGMISSIYTTGSITGNSRVGGVVGWNNNQANVNSCYSAGNATGTQAVGGLVGFNGWNSGISKSYATGNVRGNMEVGGLVGYTYIGTASNSYSRGTVTRHTGSTYTNLGGFMGENYQGKALNCYSTGRVTFEGAGDPTNKGFCGAVVTGGNYEMTGNFWDTQTSLQSTTAGG
ncbi:MAG: GLUG motif-containing protein, partial [Candidatus Thermoplasmatota archaeon]|nr:GLUG motif-containing protein [Candidatus Thermoplasmatota archaeon]